MTATHTEQYRPITTSETTADDGLNVRSVLDTGRNVNNAIVHVAAHVILAVPCIPLWYSHDNTTDERVIAQLCPVQLQYPYKKLAVVLGHCRSAGSGAITWRLYSDIGRYSGPSPVDTTQMSSSYSVATFVCDSGTHDIPAAEFVDAKVGGDAFCWLMLTAQNQDTGTTGYISSWSIWPSLS